MQPEMPALVGPYEDGRRMTGTSRTVLIVDDDAVIREVAKVALEVVGGWRVLVATNGPEGQQLALQERPDAVLMDVMMPGMDGPSTAIAMAQVPQTADIPVVFLTAKGQDLVGLGDKIALAGIIDKPFDPMTLSQQITALLGWA